MHKFVIICSGRTGSNLLCGILDQHPYISCHYELFNPSAIFKNRNRSERSKEALAARDGDPIEFIEACYRGESGSQAAGFKILFAHNPTALEHCIMNPGIKKIVLTRENRLAQYSSQKIAELTQKWLDVEGNSVSSLKIKFEPENFLEFVDEINADHQTGLDLVSGIDDDLLMHLEYSRIAERKTVASLFRFLGVPNFEIEFPPFKKQNTSDILERFENPKVVLKTLEDLGKPEWAHEQVATWHPNKTKRSIILSKRWIARVLGF